MKTFNDIFNLTFENVNKPFQNKSPEAIINDMFADIKLSQYISKSNCLSIQSDIIEKRKSALLFFMDKALKSFKKYKFDMTNIGLVFSHLEIDTLKNYNSLNFARDIRTAAALWILEELNISGKLNEAAGMLPAVTDHFLDIPDIVHPCYAPDLIEEMTSCMPESFVSNFSSVFTDIVKLLPSESVHNACSSFKRLQWEIVSKYLKYASLVDGKLSEIFKSITIPDSRASEIKAYKGLEKVQKLCQTRDYIKLNLGDILSKNKAELVRVTEDESAAEILYGSRIKNPYETCFALVCLFADGDPAPWLFGSGSALLTMAHKLLPWTVVNPENCCEELDYNHDNWLSSISDIDGIDYFNSVTGPDNLNLAQILYKQGHCVMPVNLHPFAGSRKDLIKNGFNEKEASLISLSAETAFLSNYQFQSLGNEPPLEDIMTDSVNNDFPVSHLCGYWGRVAAEWAAHKESLAAISNSSFFATPSLSEENKTTDKKANSHDEYVPLDELVKCRKKIKELQLALAKAEHDALKDKSAYEESLKNYQMEHRELADLRELVFNQDNNEEDVSQEEQKPKIQFPYTPNKRTTIFGGHDSFLRAIKPLLDNVKFVDARNMTFSQDIIRNSEVVWVQNNCISHSQYYAVQKGCKNANIQMRYFTQASATKCAEQLALEDMKPD